MAKGGDEGVEEFGAHAIEVAALWQVGKAGGMFRPPFGEALAHSHKARLHSGVGLDQRGDGGALAERGGEVQIISTTSALTPAR